MRHKSRVTRVIDGDTFEASVDLDFGISIKITVRLYGCDAYEMHGEDKAKGAAAKTYITTLIAGQMVELEPHKKDSFGRWLCDVWFKQKSIISYLTDNQHLKQKA